MKAKTGDLAYLISYNQLKGEGMLGSIMKIWKQPKCPPAGERIRKVILS